MRILVIEDNDAKFNDIKEVLNTLGYTDIDRACARNSGLLKLIRAEKPYDFLFCDNFMPIFDDSRELRPFAIDIVNEIKRRKIDIPICVCSSEEVEKGDYDYFIKYDYCVAMNDSIEYVLSDATEKKEKKEN